MYSVGNHLDTGGYYEEEEDLGVHNRKYRENRRLVTYPDDEDLIPASRVPRAFHGRHPDEEEYYARRAYEYDPRYDDEYYQDDGYYEGRRGNRMGWAPRGYTNYRPSSYDIDDMAIPSRGRMPQTCDPRRSAMREMVAPSRRKGDPDEMVLPKPASLPPRSASRNGSDFSDPKEDSFQDRVPLSPGLERGDFNVPYHPHTGPTRRASVRKDSEDEVASPTCFSRRPDTVSPSSSHSNSRRAQTDLYDDDAPVPVRTLCVPRKLKTNDTGESTDDSDGRSPKGEVYVTLVSATLLFAHFWIFVFREGADAPGSVMANKHLRNRWTLINVCILVFALASHLYRQSLANLGITFAPFILVPDVCTAGVVFLLLLKHAYFALYVLLACVTFLSVAVTVCDLFAFLYPNRTLAGSLLLQRTGERSNEGKKEDTEMLDSSNRSNVTSNSTGSVTLPKIAALISFLANMNPSKAISYASGKHKKKDGDWDDDEDSDLSTGGIVGPFSKWFSSLGRNISVSNEGVDDSMDDLEPPRSIQVRRAGGRNMDYYEQGSGGRFDEESPRKGFAYCSMDDDAMKPRKKATRSLRVSARTTRRHPKY